MEITWRQIQESDQLYHDQFTMENICPKLQNIFRSGSDHQLLAMDLKLRLKNLRTKRTTNILSELTMNHFKTGIQTDLARLKTEI